MKHTIIILTCLALAVPTATALDEKDFNVDCVFGWRGCYRPMEWTPVEIELSANTDEPLPLTLALASQQDGLNTLNIAQPLVITPEVRSYVPLVTKLYFGGEDCRVRLLDEKGRTRWSQTYDLWGNRLGTRLVEPIPQQDLLVGLVGRPGFGLTQLSQQCVCRSGRHFGKVHLKDKLPRMLPWDWPGYVSLDLLILYNPQWDNIKPAQAKAITDWVANGGKLLLVLGANPLPANHPLARSLPFELTAPRQIAIPAEQSARWNWHAGKALVVANPLRVKPAVRHYNAHTYGDDTLFATARMGFGHVAILAFDPTSAKDPFDEPLKLNTAEQLHFWTHHCRALLGQCPPSDAKTLPYDSTVIYEGSTPLGMMSPGNMPPGGGPGMIILDDSSDNQPILERTIQYVGPDPKTNDDEQDYFNQFTVGPAGLANAAVLEHLYDIPQLQPLSIWWVIWLLAVLALLLGPIDYFILKRRDRLPWTWLTCTFWICIFTVGAYYGVQALRSGKMQVRAVSVVDAIQAEPVTWATTYAGLFAARSNEYHLDLLEQPQWWSGIAPTDTVIDTYQTLRTRNIFCLQRDGSNLPRSLPINIWTMQSLLQENNNTRPSLTATLAGDPNDCRITITNLADQPATQGFVLIGPDRIFKFNHIAPNDAITLQGTPRHSDWWQERVKRLARLQHRGMHYGGDRALENAFFAQGALPRTLAIHHALADHNAALVCARYDDAPLDFEVQDNKYNTYHIQYARLLLFFQDEPATALATPLNRKR